MKASAAPNSRNSIFWSTCTSTGSHSVILLLYMRWVPPVDRYWKSNVESRESTLVLRRRPCTWCMLNAGLHIGHRYRYSGVHNYYRVSMHDWRCRDYSVLRVSYSKLTSHSWPLAIPVRSFGLIMTHTTYDIIRGVQETIRSFRSVHTL